ncbi:Serine/alanine racemase [uncultured Clostridium sp.]|uniref:acyltransferase family protein n=1 Tax=uncultured Clostridium sp. TaxID=59620 RepID=UPI000820EC50|nr:acyltransferase [uncultured Clostridium sp.]SCI82313.1 Serine/alanine racemase [uncultured Clostridium sp.]
MEVKAIRNNYNCIDLTKYICAILVLGVHFISDYGENNINFIFSQGIGRVAVPFFFITSGYFLANRSGDTIKIQTYLLKIFRLYALWSAIYFPYELYMWKLSNSSIVLDIVIYIKNFFLVGSFIHLWYLLAVITAVILIEVLLKKFSINKVLIIGFILYILGMIGDGYYGVLINIPLLKKIYDFYLSLFETTRNGLFFGMFFISLGYFINIKRVVIKKSISLLFLIMSIFLIIIEIYFMKSENLPLDYNMYISIIPATFFLFNLTKEIQLKDNKIYPMLRSMSVTVFLIQFMFNGIFLFFISFLDEYKLIKIEWIRFVFIAILSNVFSYLIIRLKNKYKAILKKGS